MNKEKTRKIVLISIIAAGLLLFVAIIAVAISFFMDKNNKPSKETTQLESSIEENSSNNVADKETTKGEELEEDLTSEENVTDIPTTEEATSTEAVTEKATEPPTVQQPVVEEPMKFSVVDGVLYQSNSKKTEKVESGLYSYEISTNKTAIYYNIKGEDAYYIRIIGQDKVKIDIGNIYSMLRLYDTGEAYFLGETIYTNEIYWCRTPIYYFNGKKSVLLTDKAPCGQMSSVPTTKVALETPIIMFEEIVNLQTGEVDDFVLAFKDKIQDVDLSDAGGIWTGNIVIQDQGKKIWYSKYENDIKYLYEVKIINGKCEPAKLLDYNLGYVTVDPVNCFGKSLDFFGEDVVYYKNCKTLYEPDFSPSCTRYSVVDSADMYISGKYVDENVYVQSVSVKGNSLFYYTDYNVETWSGTLKKYSNGKIKILAKAVDYYQFLDNGKLEITYVDGRTEVIAH